MATTPSDSERFDASEMGRREFTRTRRGWDPVEVRAHLLRMADEIARLQRSDDDLRAKVSRFEAAAADPEELDESRLTRLLGEETARVLEAARHAANDIRSKAEDAAGRLVRDAQEQATRDLRDAEELRQAAALEADELVASARQRAEEILAEARDTAADERAEADAEATATRERAERAAADLRTEADADAERVRAAAAEIRLEADEHSARVRREADDAATAVRDTAASDAAEMRGNAEAAANQMRSDAADAARERAEEADRAAAAEVERAREQGRGMIHEAKEARERMLRDLAERRKVARQQLEALRAGRERLLDAFQSVRGAFDDATEQLVESLPAARTAADEAARAVDDDIEAAVAELDAEIGGHDAEPTGLDVISGDNLRDADVRPDLGPGADAPTEPGTLAEAGGSRLRLVPGSGGGLDDDLEDDDLDDEFDHPESTADDAPGGSVDELFARLRADQHADTDARRSDDESGDADDDLSDDDMSGDDDVVDDLDRGVVLAFGGERTEVADVVELAGDEPDEQPDDASEEAPTAASTAVLDRRDERLANAERNVTRRLKRALSDQENAVLHTVRGDRKARDAEALLGDAAMRARELAEPVVAELIAAVDAGAGLFDDDDHSVAVDAETVAAELAPLVDEWLSEPLRDRLERAVTEGDLGGDRGELVERLRGLYRELRHDRLDELVGDLVTAACNQGVLAASRPGVTHVWLVDHGGLPCPDGEDNHLAGAVAVGEPFPTGDLRPPAQPGCRCLLVPAPR